MKGKHQSSEKVQLGFCTFPIHRCLGDEAALGSDSSLCVGVSICTVPDTGVFIFGVGGERRGLPGDLVLQSDAATWADEA